MNNKSEKRIQHNKRRRNNKIKRNILLFISTFVVAIVCTIVFGKFLSQAQSSDENIYIKYYRSIEIMQSESLESIAKNNISDFYYNNIDEYIDEIKYINNLQDDVIYAGEYIVIPYYSSTK